MPKRNDPCPCGSGKKYKKCCLDEQRIFTVIDGGLANPKQSEELPADLLKVCEDLELLPNEFYTRDLVEFYIAKTEGKGKGTVQKYKSSVKLIGEALAGFEAFSWKDLRPDFWNELICFDLVELMYDPTYRKAENFFSVLTHFAKWTDKKYGWDNEEFVKFIIDKNKYAIMDCIYNHMVIVEEIQKQFFKARYNYFSGIHTIKEGQPGFFMVHETTSTTIKALDLLTEKMYTIKVPKEVLTEDTVYTCMVIQGEITKETNKRNWEFCQLETIYPPNAMIYVKQNFAL